MFEYLFAEQGLSIERLRGLIDVYNAGGISKAAPQNKIKQTILGRQVRELETFFGVRLTFKKGKVIELNEAGIELAKQAQAGFFLLEDFKHKSVLCKKKLKIASGGTLMDQLLSPRMDVLCKAFPSFSLHFVENFHVDIYKRLDDASVDFGVLWGAEIPTHFSKALLGIYEYGLYIPKKLLPKKTLSAEELLKQLPFAFIKHRGFMDNFLDQMKPNMVFVNENSQAFHLVQSQSYGAILPTLWGKDLDKSIVKIPFKPLDAYSRKTHLIWNPQWTTLKEINHSMVSKITQILKFS